MGWIEACLADTQLCQIGQYDLLLRAGRAHYLANRSRRSSLSAVPAIKADITKPELEKPHITQAHAKHPQSAQMSIAINTAVKHQEAARKVKEPTSKPMSIDNPAKVLRAVNVPVKLVETESNRGLVKDDEALFSTASDCYRNTCLLSDEAAPEPALKGQLNERQTTSASSVTVSLASTSEVMPLPSLRIRDLKRKPVYRERNPNGSPGFSFLGLLEKKPTSAIPVQQRLNNLSSAIKAVKAKSRAASAKVESPPSSSYSYSNAQRFPPAGPSPWSGWKSRSIDTSLAIKAEDTETVFKAPILYLPNPDSALVHAQRAKITSQSTRKGLPAFKREDLDDSLAEALCGSTPFSLKWVKIYPNADQR